MKGQESRRESIARDLRTVADYVTNFVGNETSFRDEVRQLVLNAIAISPDELSQELLDHSKAGEYPPVSGVEGQLPLSQQVRNFLTDRIERWIDDRKLSLTGEEASALYTLQENIIGGNFG